MLLSGYTASREFALTVSAVSSAISRALPMAAAFMIVIGPATASDVRPQQTYVFATTFAGAAGGALLGASLGGLSRNRQNSRVKPFLRWGAAGAALGIVLGRTIGLDLVDRSREIGDTAHPSSSRETGALLGTILGEAVGFGIVSALHQPVTRDSREIWAGIALGACIGAAAGYLLPPMSFLAPPPAKSRRELESEKEMHTMEPPAGLTSAGADFIQRTRPAKTSPRPRMATRAPLDTFLGPEQEHVLKPEPFHPSKERPLVPAITGPTSIRSLSRSVTNLGLLEGALLGGAIGASVGGNSADLGERIVISSTLGLLAGWSATSAITRPWRAAENGDFLDMSDALGQGRRLSGLLAGGLIGTLVGGAVGAILINSVDSFDQVDVGRSMLAGNVAGLIVGRILTSGEE